MINSFWKTSLVTLSIISLNACATPQTQIKNTLVEKGLSEPMAECMAARLVDKLSTKQLLKIRKLKKFERKEVGDISANQFIKYTRALQDPKIIAVTTSSVLFCSF